MSGLAARAKACHEKYPLMDGHNDLPWALFCGFANKIEPQNGGPDLSQDLREAQGLRQLRRL